MASEGEEAPVKKSRFSEEQMVKILREADRSPVPEVAKRHGISDRRSTPGGSASARSSPPM
jgi:putative transposase